jgi:uncharacterized protein
MLLRSQGLAQTFLVLLVAGVLLAGCETGMPERITAEAEAYAAEAREWQGAGNWQAAAEAWQRAAEAARGAARDAPLLAAAQAWLRAGEPEKAQSALAAVSTDPGSELAAQRALTEARVLLRTGEPAAALALLATVPMGPDDPEAAELMAVRADAAFADRQPALGVAALARREMLLTDPIEQSANQRRIWSRMQEATAAGLSLEAPRSANPLVTGWLEIGRIAAESGGNAFRLRAGLDDWRVRNPDHPATLDLVSMLLAESRVMTEYPQRIALLLPLSGRQSASAAAVRDGFIAGYLAHGNGSGNGNGGERPALRMYDTHALGVTAAFELAARNGADFIVGPLLKEDLAELAAAELPAVPSLALNWADDHVRLPAYLVQFALAPEQEAAAVARRAFQDGHRRALALAHDTDQGRRMAESFIAAFRAEGGEVVGLQLFDPRDRDYSVEITGLLLLEESRARHQRLQAALGRSLDFEPRRRQDAGFLFLAARPNEALLIRPQLRFHYAGDLPVYGTSLMYDPSRSDNAELDGVLFADMPWRVGAGDTAFMAEFSAFGPHALDRNGRLYAFGADAYRLVPLLHNRSASQEAGVEGLTGTLRIGLDGRVQRDLAWGRFQRGKVRHAPPPALLPPRVVADDVSPLRP